jgi:hypothetical protein
MPFFSPQSQAKYIIYEELHHSGGKDLKTAVPALKVLDKLPSFFWCKFKGVLILTLFFPKVSLRF